MHGLTRSLRVAIAQPWAYSIGQKTPPFSRPSVAIGVYLWLDPHSSFTLKISLALEFSSVKNYTIFLELEHETDEFGNSYFRRFNNC